MTLSATGTLAEGIACSIEAGRAAGLAGLHPAAGGDGSALCSGDMLLQALAACAGVTLRSVSTSLEISVTGTVRAEGDLDFRGTLSISADAPVGFRAIRLIFELATEAGDAEVERLLELTERYCVVYQTIASSSPIEISCVRAG